MTPDEVSNKNAAEAERVADDIAAGSGTSASGQAWDEDGAALLADLIRQSQDALIIREFDGTIRDMNPAAERLYGYTVEEARGKSVHDLFENRFAESREVYEAALLREGHWTGEIAQRRRDGSEVVVSSRQTLRRGANAGEPDIVLASNRDVSEQHRALRRLRRLFDSRVVGVIFWHLDTEQITEANDTFLAMVGYTREDLAAGRLNFRAMTPPEWMERNEEGVAAIRRTGSASTYEKEYFRKDGSRIPILIGGTRFEDSGTEGFSFVLDNTEQRKLRQEQDRLYTEAYTRADRESLLSDASRLLNSSLDYNDTLATVARLIVPRFADWCAVDILDEMGNPQRVAVEHVDPEKAAWGWELGRRYPTRMDDERGIAAVLRTGEPNFTPHITDEMLIAAITDEQRLRLMQEIGFTSVIIVPLAVRDNVFGALSLIATRESNRVFTTDDLRFAQEIGQRAGLAVENARLFRVTQRRADRETLLNRIGEAVRGTLEPEAILRAVVAALGQGLGADRCYFVRYNQTRDTARVSPEWLRDGAEIRSIADRNLQMSIFSVDRDDSYKAGRTHVVDDVVAFDPTDAEPLLSVDIRSLLRVPIEVGDEMTALAVSMAYEPRHWIEDEVRLVENVAALLHAALESALVQQREHNIAQQLQEALQPSVPKGFPGLALASLYSAALGEAEVGGDFHDAFHLGGGRFGLVVADLAGKGLNAASQVALVRHQLRYALYTADLDRADSVAAAVQTLNGVLATRGLLVGFATLFVGVWDAGADTFTYVNAGQEPALIWRAATGNVETLVPTGPVLGGFEGATFSQSVVSLAPGDVWTAFSDGMTEIGPSRKELLGIEGVVPLFARCCADCRAAGSAEAPGLVDPQAVLARLVEAVKSFSRGTGMRDDLCVLVGVRLPASSESNTSARPALMGTFEDGLP